MSDLSVRPVPGSVPRNGLPSGSSYTYRGLGYDQLDPRSLGAQRRTARFRRRVQPPAPDGRCGTCGYLVTAPGHRIACEAS